ncbi:CBS domain-containing protein [Fulvimarina endophytica]|nr:CBS domain-containing protein [Fulvimarina endophytica]
MSRDLEFADPADDARALAEMMGELDVGSVPIGTAENPLGIVTDRDILFRVVARGLEPSSVLARDIMSAPLLECDPDDNLDTALAIMAAQHVRRLAVRSPDGPIVGWITLADLSRRLLLGSGSLQNALTEISSDSAA